MDPPDSAVEDRIFVLTRWMPYANIDEHLWRSEGHEESFDVGLYIMDADGSKCVDSPLSAFRSQWRVYLRA